MIMLRIQGAAVVLTSMMLTGLAGCGANGPAMYSVVGQIRLTDGDARLLAGHSVEAALESDPLVRAYGEIQEDGSFALETFRAGAVRKGTVQGKFRARIVLSDDNPERRRLAAEAIHSRFRDFDGSGLTFESPAAERVTLTLSRR